MKKIYFFNYRNLLPAFLLIASLATSLGNAQCGPYQGFESFTASAAVGSLKEGLSGGSWFVSFTARNTSPYSGLNALTMSAASSYIITPKIASIQNFSFYYRAGSTGTPAGFKVQYSTNFNGLSTGIAAATWIDVSSVSTAIVPNSNLATQKYTTTGYNLFTVDLTGINNSGAGGIYVRINDNRDTTPTPIVPTYIDDLSWTSTDPDQNLEIVMPKSVSSTCTQNLTAGKTYTIYDNGGYADNYNAGQTNIVTVVPPAGYNAAFAMNSAITANYLSPTGGSCASTLDELILYNGTTSGTLAGNYQQGCVTKPVPASVMTSTDCTGKMTAKLFSDATANAASAVGTTITVTTSLAALCSDVSAVLVTAGSATADGATITWTAPCPAPLNYDYYVSTSATAPTAGTTAAGTVSGASPSVTITGLSSSTSYYVWIRSNCGAGVYGGWFSPGAGPHFTTLCSAYGVPYLEDFNGLNGPLPVCTSSNASAGIWKTNITNGNLYASSASAVNTMFYTKPLSLISGTTYRLTYDYSTLGGTADFNVYYGTALTAPSAANITTLLFSHSGASAITSNVVDFVAPSTGTFYIGFKLTSLSVPASTFFNLDNISLDIETCFPPTLLNHTNETTSSSDISWTAPASTPSNGYQYYVSTSNATPNYNVPPTGTAAGTSVTAAGLTANTTYYLWVRSNCGGKYSTWSVYTTFTTLPNPSADVITLPTGTSGITTCNAIFYDAGGAASNYAAAVGGPGNYVSSTYTITPGIPGKQIKVVFSSFATESNYDGLLIYDGANTSAPLLSSGAVVGTDPVSCPAGAYSGTNSPGTIYSTLGNGLTFVFKSDWLITYSGWAATVSCVTLPSITSFTPAGNSCGGTGTPVTITGNNFTAAPVTSVAFNGTPAVYTVVNNTTITTTLPAGATTGPITVSNSQATATSDTAFQVLGAAPTISTTNISVCPGASSGTTFTSSFNCTGYGNSGLTYAGNWLTSSPTAPKPTSAGNSSTCSFTGTMMPYVSTTFQVSVTGTYVFTMSDYGTYDAMAYITTGAFVAGSCGSGTLIKVDDDSGPGLQPQLTASLVQGVTYTLYTTVYSNPGANFAFDYTITPPTGGELMLLTNTVNWYDSPTGTTLLAQGTSFDPIAVGAANPFAPGVYNFYAACASNTTCRTPFTFTITTPPTVTLTPSGSVCANKYKALTVTGTANTLSWSSSIAGTLFIDTAGTAYSGQNLTTVYLKTNATATVTVIGTDTTTTCTTTSISVQTISTKTWSGTWSGNGLAPTSGETIVIASTGTFTNLGGCSCTVNAGATVNINGIMTLEGDLNVAPTALMTFNDDASLVQTDTPASNTNVGTIIYKRNTAMRKFDYTYWSSPVQAQYLYNTSPTPPFLDGVGVPLPMQPDKYYWFDTSVNQWTAPTPAIPVSNTTMAIGRGYIIRAPVTGAPDNTIENFTFTFTGKPNNGDYPFSVFKGIGDLNCIGNPYPSAISANLFISQNTTAFGSGAGSGTSLYFWTHNTPISGALTYVFSDYAIYNYTGGTVTTGGAAPAPNGKIAAGQSFMVKAVFAGSRAGTFTNSMRLGSVGDNTYFYRNSNAIEADAYVASLDRNRVWLNMTNDTGYFKQILVGYIQNASNGFDSGFDAENIEAGNAISLYSILENKKLGVQGKALPFTDSDIVPLGYRSDMSSSYTITLADFDGLFDQQQVYLEDTLLHLTHSLKDSPYSFVTEPGTFDSRFILRFNDNLLSVEAPAFDSNAVIVIKENSNISIKTSVVKMKSVQIYDVRGRLIAEKQQLNCNSTSFENLSLANQVLIINITSEDGITITKKVIF